MQITIDYLMINERKYFSKMMMAAEAVYDVTEIYDLKPFTKQYKEYLEFFHVVIKPVKGKKFTFWLDENTWLMIFQDDLDIQKKMIEIKQELDVTENVFVAYILMLTRPQQWKRIQGSLAGVIE